MASANLYEVLGVDPSASPEELKRAYRALARQYHPDATGADPEAEARFKEVNQAYEILSDPESRANYDRFGSAAGPGDPFMGAGSVQDIFDMFFGSMGGRAERRGPQSGPDAEVALEITLVEAAFGAAKDVTVNLARSCAECAGTGAAPGTTPVTCSECQGTGEVRRVRTSILGQMVTSQICTRCRGLGTRIESPCPSCRGDGRRTESVTLTVQVPAGVEDGSTMRLADRGPAGPRGGPNGRLFVHLRVRPDERFERHGDDLHQVARITFAQAVLGTTITVPTLGEPTDVVVEPGSASGSVVRLRHEGVEHLHGRGRGDLYVHLEVEVPTELDGPSEDLLRQWAAHRKETVDEPATGLFHRRRSRR